MAVKITEQRTMAKMARLVKEKLDPAQAAFVHGISMNALKLVFKNIPGLGHMFDSRKGLTNRRKLICARWVKGWIALPKDVCGLPDYDPSEPGLLWYPVKYINRSIQDETGKYVEASKEDIDAARNDQLDKSMDGGVTREDFSEAIDWALQWDACGNIRFEAWKQAKVLKAFLVVYGDGWSAGSDSIITMAMVRYRTYKLLGVCMYVETFWVYVCILSNYATFIC